MRGAFYIAGKLVPSQWAQRLQQVTGKYVICPFYHAVSNTPLPHISPLYRHRTEDEFRKDIEWLTAHYEPIRWSEIDRYEREKRPAFCLTFDDGLKEFYTIVAPILEEKHIPCVCFLNSAFVDNKDMMFRYKTALQSQGIDWHSYLEREQPYLSSAQIRDLQARGFEFGSHSVDHPYYENLSLETQLTETLVCDTALRQQFGLQHRLFAYPFGQGRLSRTALHVHQGTHEMVFGTGNLRFGGSNMVNRIAMDGTAMPIKDVIYGEYIREMVHQWLHD